MFLLLKDLVHSRLLPGTLEALDHVQLVQSPLKGVVLEQTGVTHALLDAGEVDESDELDEQLAFQASLRGDEDAPHVKTLLEVAEGLLHKVLVAVQVERRGGVHKHGVDILLAAVVEATGSHISAQVAPEKRVMQLLDPRCESGF